MIYRPVPGYDDLYAGMDGTIIHGEKGNLRQKVAGQGYRGYHHVSIPAPCGGLTVAKVYRLVAAAFLGPQPPGMHVRHINGDSWDNSVGNLCYGTAKDNAQDSIRHGTNNNARKTHCARGHEYTPDNIYTTPGTIHRGCRKCRTENNAKHNAGRYGPSRIIPEEKRQRIKKLILEKPLWSNRAIAERTGVSHTFVRRIRLETFGTGDPKGR